MSDEDESCSWDVSDTTEPAGAESVYYMRKGRMYKVVHSAKGNRLKMQQRKKRARKEAKPTPIPDKIPPGVEVSNKTPHQGHLRVKKGNREYDIFVDGGVPKAKPGLDAPTQLEKKIAGVIREAEGELEQPLSGSDPLLSYLQQSSIPQDQYISWLEQCTEETDRAVLLHLLTMRELRPTEVADTPSHDEAKAKEIRSWQENKVYIKVKKSDPRLRHAITIDSRWVLTDKDIRGDGGKLLGKKHKARLVARGFWEAIMTAPGQKEGFRTDSPTTSRDAAYMILSLAGRFGHEISSLDAVTAFLQSDNGFEGNRSISLTVPEDAARLMGLADDEQILLLKSVYGLSDAPLRWFRSLNRVLTEEVGMTRSTVDPCLWYWINPQTKCAGLAFGAHVDDLLICNDRSPQAMALLQEIKKHLQFSELELPPFKYCGKMITATGPERASQVADTLKDAAVTVDPTIPGYVADQRFYGLMLEPIKVPRGVDPAGDCPHLKREYLSLLGALLWLIQSNPAIAYDVSHLAGETNQLTWQAVRDLNKATQRAKDKAVILCYQATSKVAHPSDLAFVVWHDAAFQGERKGKTQGGYMIGMCPKVDITVGCVSNIHWITWWSGRLTRVVQSTFAAEAMAAHEAWQRASHLAALWQEFVLGVQPKMKGPGGEGFLPIHAFTDSMALKDHLYSPRHLILDRRLGALVSSLKDYVTQDNIKCRHVRTHFQLADALTKSMEPDLIVEVLSTGKVTLQGEAPKKPQVQVSRHESTSLVCQFRRARKAQKREKKTLKVWK